MDFIKMQGTGNDFVLIDARGLDRDWAALARAMCDRHFGVGADGILLIRTSEVADLCLRMFNPDGSEAEACGNGLRCFARYAADSGLVDDSEFNVETMAGIRAVRTQAPHLLQVAMGTPVFDPAAIPVAVERAGKDAEGRVIDYPVAAGGRELKVTCVSMGNPHAVCFLDEPVDGFPLANVGPLVEHHPMFPKRTNFEIANVLGRNQIRARVWERGAGETLSCGTGACAIAVVSIIKDLGASPVDVRLPGGTLKVDWNASSEVLLSGPAEVVFHGVWPD